VSAIPAGCRRALDVGCGTGGFARVLAEKCEQVDAIDRDADVIARARGGERVSLICGDVMTYPLEPGYDLITAIASLHHLPLVPAVERLTSLLAPGGVLAVIGLYRRATLTDLLFDAIAFPISRARRLWRRRTWDPVPLKDPKETLAEIRAAFPEAEIRRRLLFRYTLIYRAR